MSFDFSQLPNGITGTRNNPKIAGQFKSACYLVARKIGFEVKKFWKHGESKTHNGDFTYDNYHAAFFSKKELQLLVLCNAAYPVIAFTQESTFLEKEFIDVPHLAKKFREFTEFFPLEASYLNQDIDKNSENSFLSLLDG
jgi:hypothetical protein